MEEDTKRVERDCIQFEYAGPQLTNVVGNMYELTRRGEERRQEMCSRNRAATAGREAKDAPLWRLTMTEQEARETMKVYRWSFLRRSRQSNNYVYAARKVRGQRQEVYTGSLISLETMTVETLVEKLTGTHSL
ncbi:MAG TPA: hypothetical protein VEL31_11745 [Ktedonobacteraceae bacterium]|nr:hypothetical protein [Ktedonobacteraceae bacterium]